MLFSNYDLRITIYGLLFFVFGLSVGSFLNVIIDRLESDESILMGRSHCDSCKHVLYWYDLIPIFSFLWLRGRCRYCKKPLSCQYPLVEFSTGVLFMLTWMKFTNLREFSANWHEFLYWLLIVSAMIVIFVYDLKHKIIPDKIVLPATLVSFVFVILSAAKNPDGLPAQAGISRPSIGSGLEMTLASAIVAGLFFLTLILVTKGRGMGGGDVKLAFLMGLILGWPQILIALYLSFITGALVGLILIATGKKHFGQEIPFGPFLSASTIVTLLYGDILLHLFQKIIPIV